MLARLIKDKAEIMVLSKSACCGSSTHFLWEFGTEVGFALFTWMNIVLTAKRPGFCTGHVQAAMLAPFSTLHPFSYLNHNLVIWYLQKWNWIVNTGAGSSPRLRCSTCLGEIVIWMHGHALSTSFMRWKSYNIKVTILECTVQWYFVYAQNCAHVTST